MTKQPLSHVMDTPLGPTGGQRLYSLDALGDLICSGSWVLKKFFNELVQSNRFSGIGLDFQPAYPPGLERISFIRPDFPACFFYGRGGHTFFRGQGTGKGQAEKKFYSV